MPKRDLNFPIQSVQFSRDEAAFVLGTIADVISHSIEGYGKSARFSLSLDLKYIPRKRKPCPK
ncbi:MAG: hypothetical protein KAV00_03300 [Phycisphaerae bacterium]|nr:hypothetical protein [Phycisphaerae bacterium]